MSTDSDPIAKYAHKYSWAMRWATQPAPPPPEKLKAYAALLEPIYVDLLVAFQASGPVRMQGEPVAFGTIQNHLLGEEKKYTEAELSAALGNLVSQGILTESGVWYAPTKLGEALIGVLTGSPATPVSVPELPKPTW